MKQKIKVVLLDNDDKGAALLKAEFEKRENCGEILIAHNGEDGKELIEKFQPDVVICELLLPQADGFEVLKAFACRADKPKFLVYTSLSHENFITKAVLCGANYYMLKPTESKVLWERVEGLCQSEQRVQALPQREVRQPNYGTKLLDERLSNVFVTVGIPANLKGYQFLREGVKLTVDQPSMINNVTKQLYPAIARKFETSASKVERAIRHAIEVAWNRGRMENINTWYGVKVYSSYEKPTNSEFIALVADKLMLEIM